jgi:hypothetical protein
MNAIYGSIADKPAACANAAETLKRGGWLVISHLEGKSFVHKLRDTTDLFIEPYPRRTKFPSLVGLIGLEVIAYRDEPKLYLATARKMRPADIRLPSQRTARVCLRLAPGKAPDEHQQRKPVFRIVAPLASAASTNSKQEGRNEWALSVSGGSHIGRWRNQAGVAFLIRFVDTLTDLLSRPPADRNTTDSISSLPWDLSRKSKSLPCARPCRHTSQHPFVGVP